MRAGLEILERTTDEDAPSGSQSHEFRHAKRWVVSGTLRPGCRNVCLFGHGRVIARATTRGDLFRRT